MASNVPNVDSLQEELIRAKEELEQVEKRRQKPYSESKHLVCEALTKVNQINLAIIKQELDASYIKLERAKIAYEQVHQNPPIIPPGLHIPQLIFDLIENIYNIY
jgi:hypothetical protein